MKGTVLWREVVGGDETFGAVCNSVCLTSKSFVDLSLWPPGPRLLMNAKTLVLAKCHKTTTIYGDWQ